MAKDIDIHIEAQGDEQAKRKLDGLSKSAKSVGDKTAEAGRKADSGSKGIDKTGRAAGRAAGDVDGLGNAAKRTGGKAGMLASAFSKLLIKLVAIATAVRVVTAAFRANTEEIDKNAEAAIRQAEKLLRLQHLGDLFKEKPDVRKEVEAYAEFGRRPFEEVADAWYNLRSKSGALSPQTRKSILQEALELGRTDPEMPLDTLVDMFTLYAKKTGQTDANRIQNILKQTITEAGGGGADVASYMPRFLPTGMAGDLTGPEAAGLWAYATTQTSNAAVATTGLQALFLGLQGKGTPESAKIIEGLGIDPKMPFFQKMGLLSAARKSGKFGLGQAEQLAGREGSSLLLDMLKDPAAMMRTVSRVVAVNRGDIDLARTGIEELLGQDEMARLYDHFQQLNVMSENLKGQDTEALRWKLIEKAVEVKGFKQEWSPVRKKIGYGAVRALEMMGVSPTTMFPWSSGDLKDFPALTTPQEEQPPAEPAQPIGGPVSIHYDYSTHNHPAVGSSDIGPRVGEEWVNHA